MKKLLQMKFMLLLCALIVGSGTMWAADPITLWSEDFSSYSANDVPSGGTYNYSCGGENTMIYDAALAGGKSPELLLQKNSNGTFTATIPLDNIEGDLTLTFKTNNQKIKVETTTNGLTGGLEEKASGTHTATFKGVTTSTTSITIKFTCSGSSNVRLDDIVLTGTKSSGGGDTPTTWTVTYDGNGATSGSVPVDNTEYDSENSTVTVLGNTGSLAKEHYTFNNWNTADDGSGTGYVAGNTFTISGNTTLYAQWAINSHNVTLPAQNEFGVYTMSAVNPVAYGTEVTLTYNPASGYEKYVAAWSVNGTALEGNKFTMPDEDVTVTVELTEITIDFESAATAYTDWAFTNIVSNYSNTDVTAHGGSKYGSTNGKASGSIQTKEKVNPASLTCYVSKQTNNASSSTWYIQVSSDGSTWTDVTTNSATDMGKGAWKKITADLKNYSDVYVRVYYSGSTAVRLIDDLTLVLKNDTRAEAGLAFNESSYSVELVNAASFTSPELTNPHELPITWTSSNETVATVNEGTVTILSEGETTIKAKFEGNDDYKPGEASYTLTVVDNRQTATVTWKDADGNNITELNVEKGDFIQGITLSCNVEGFTFTEEHLQHLWGTNKTHDNYDGLQPAGYIFTPNAVWTAALGITTITATFPGNETHKPASATLTVNVTGGTETTPYTVAEARAAIDAGTGITGVYATGIVSEIVDPYSSQYKNITYNISADGSTTSNQLQAFRGKSYNGNDFTSADDIQVGDVVVVYGDLKKYEDTYEFAQNNQLVSLVRKPAAPAFDPEAGSYTSVQNVTISTTTAGAAIYYTTDGTDPTTESTPYSGAITVDESMTIKAIAVKDSEISDVATAVYDIDLSPVITVASPIELDGNTPSKNITISYNNFTPGSDDFGVVYCDENGDELSGGYDWIEKIAQWIDPQIEGTATILFKFDLNTGSAPRTAYMKIYAMNGNDRVYSELITITQEVYVEPAKVSFNVNGGPIQYSYLEEGDPIVFPEVSDIDGMTFLGWTSTEINGTTDTAPEFVDVTSAKMGTESIDYYAVFALLVAPGTTSTVTDELTKALTGASGNSYSSWEGKKASSDAVYKGNSAGGNDAIQLRSNNNSGIVTTTSGGKAKKVTVTWNSNTTNERTLDIYGKNSAYESAADLYNNTGQGTKIGSIVYGTNTVLIISDDYKYIGLRSNNGAMYLDKIAIEWETTTPDSYNDYCTTIPEMLTVTIAEACTDGSKYYGTYSSSSAFKVPANVTVSEIGIDAEGKMDVQNYASGAIVPANTGVMVSAETFGNFKLVKSTEDGVDILNGANRLRPSGDDGITADEMDGKDSGCKFYRLTMHNGTQIGFWWGADGGDSFAIVANKAYMAVPAGQAAREGFAFDDDSTTGISNVNVNENVNGSVFDLQGRKVSTPGKGLYIVNGKKVVIK